MMISTIDDNREQKSLVLPFLLVVGAYFALHIALRVMISGSLDYDEAEQALLSQWLLAGYTEQPPLYSWLQYFLFAFLGKNVFAVSLLKNSLMFFTYLAVFFAARQILHDDRRAILASLSLLLIPQIGWESQRDMTHTTLVVFAAAATLWSMLRLISQQSLFNYCVLGLLLGVGFLAKANFALFLTVLVLTLACFAEGRKVLFSKKILISLLIVATFCGTYALWMANNQDIVFSATHKFKRQVEYFWLKGPVSLLTTVFQFLTPLWLICLFVFSEGFRIKGTTQNGFHKQFISKFLLILFLALLTAVLIGKVTYVKDRWLQPLLFVAPVFFFTRISPKAIENKRFNIYLAIVAAAAIAIYSAFTIRVVGASYTGSFCRLNYPFATLAQEMRQLGFANGLIISDDRFIAGNFHLRFPGSTAIIPEYRFEKLVKTGEYDMAAVVWKTGQSLDIPTDLSEFIASTYGIQTSSYPVYYMEHPYLYGRNKTLTLAVIFFPLTKLPDAAETKL